ncbi:MAG: META domain-containing protein, partial [Anaerolineae bacterium]|nr:META domain-containing protein [Anaerolineae bacterium]
MKTNLLVIAILASLLLAACGGAVPQPLTTPAASTPTAAESTPTETAPAAEDTGSPDAEVSLTTQPWQWTALSGAEDKVTVETPDSYQVTFSEDGTVAVVADCNNAAGTYTDEDGALTVALGPMTAAACPEGSRSEQFAT